MAKTETVFIWTGDYGNRLDALYAATKAAKDDDAELLAGEEHPYDTLAAEYEALKAEAEEAGIKVEIRGLGDEEWFELTDAHPPRPENQTDEALGFNERTGKRPLIHAALIDPEFPTRAKFDEWVRDKGLTRGDVEMLALRVFRLTNGTSTTSPKSLPALPTRSAGENSE